MVVDENHTAFEGDLFERVYDIENPSYWKAVSLSPQLQVVSRYDVVTQYDVDYIVPGHGAMFQLTEEHVELLASQKYSTSADWVLVALPCVSFGVVSAIQPGRLEQSFV